MTNPLNLSFSQLCKAYPSEWQEVEGVIKKAVGSGEFSSLNTYMVSVRTEATGIKKKLKQKNPGKTFLKKALPVLVKERLMVLAFSKFSDTRLKSEVKNQAMALNWFQGTLVQKLLFKKGYQRKPVSLPLFRLLWPLIKIKSTIMALARKKGIYCFYSGALLKALAKEIGTKSCVEVAAGDGTLAEFLRKKGVSITATDDFSWEHCIDYDKKPVEKLSAQRTLSTYNPEVVICSWPPPGNKFEASILSHPSVMVYIVIGSKHHYATGNWQTYESQKDFSWSVDESLTKLVLPPELDNAVLVFRRKDASKA